ncbi:TPA: hypothetical protein DHU97_03130 [Candidatus Saccharibacteria bacterium]|nr:hypothetical protein [Candidatus Saccharibacteria bacterium]
MEALNEQIEQLKRSLPEMNRANKKLALQKLLVLQTPRAALAQNQMDRHKHGYHNREKRLYELIDFNDTFVAVVLALDRSELARFTPDIKQRMSDFCRQQDTLMFSDEQFEAIVHGLSVEISVYRAAHDDGLDVEMTSRTQDAFGIDMVVGDPSVRRQINIDCKTPSAFRYRLEELRKKGRITDSEVLQADEQDFITTMNRHDDEKVPVTTLCIRPERVGDIADFSLGDTKPLGSLLRSVIAVDGYPY